VAGLGVGCGGLGLSALAGAPWWVAAGAFGVAALQVLAGTLLGIVRGVVPQTSRDRRAVWEQLPRRRPGRQARN